MKAEHVRKVALMLAPLYIPVNPSLWKMMNEELNELENLSDIGQAYQWAYGNGIVTIDPESLVKKFMEASK